MRSFSRRTCFIMKMEKGYIPEIKEIGRLAYEKQVNVGFLTGRDCGRLGKGRKREWTIKTQKWSQLATQLSSIFSDMCLWPVAIVLFHSSDDGDYDNDRSPNATDKLGSISHAVPRAQLHFQETCLSVPPGNVLGSLFFWAHTKTTAQILQCCGFCSERLQEAGKGRQGRVGINSQEAEQESVGQLVS